MTLNELSEHYQLRVQLAEVETMYSPSGVLPAQALRR